MSKNAVAIIGGGFAGAVCAIHLMRLSKPPKLIVVYEPNEKLGLGLAYGVRDDNLRLNVPPTRMGVGVEEEDDFSAWLQNKQPELIDLHKLERSYVPRYVYGDFLQELLEDTISIYHGEFTHSRELVTELPNGFDKTFLCLGNGQSKVFNEQESDLIVNNPWDVKGIRCLATKQHLAIVGTGLSACDAAAVLEDEGFAGQITFYSSETTFPLVDAPLGEMDDFDLEIEEGLSTNLHALQLLKKTRKGIAQYSVWQEGFGDFKGAFLKLWPNLSAGVQHKLNSKLRKFWFIHRYRLAPDLFKLMQRKLSEGCYQFADQRVQEIRLDSDKVEVLSDDKIAKYFDGVINCAGPQKLVNSLVNTLVANGNASISAEKTGLCISPKCQLLDAGGMPNRKVIVIGSLTESYYGDLVGAADIVEQIVSVL